MNILIYICTQSSVAFVLEMIPWLIYSGSLFYCQSRSHGEQQKVSRNLRRFFADASTVVTPRYTPPIFLSLLIKSDFPPLLFYSCINYFATQRLHTPTRSLFVTQPIAGTCSGGRNLQFSRRCFLFEKALRVIRHMLHLALHRTATEHDRALKGHSRLGRFRTIAPE